MDNHKDGGYIKLFIELKKRNPNVKLLAGIGGWKTKLTLFSGIAANPTTRTKFAQNVANFCNHHGFDGFDLNWIFPQDYDKENFTLLLKDLRKALGSKSFSVATTAVQSSAEKSYNIAEVATIVDFVNLKTYDFTLGSYELFEVKTAIVAPMYAGSDQNKEFNVDACVKYWLSKGCPSEKIILGIPTYGRSFSLEDNSENGINAATDGRGFAGPFTQEVGMLGYNKVSYKF